MSETLANLLVSVVVVSRDRPAALLRCLTGLGQLQYPSFEIVVVADPKGEQAVAASHFAELIKLVGFDRANISEARNLGVSHAAGDIVAFIDDDAVPEPSWLTQLVAPAQRPHVAAMGGFVRGRNGISHQWRARSVDMRGDSADLDTNPKRATILTPKGHIATKTEGTNMAVRRDVLVDLEGFDPGFAFYLDETDLNLRLARAGHATAVVPMAEVHHGFEASPRRRRDRVPSDLYDIGSSWAVFQRKYLPEAERPAHWRAIRDEERRRVEGHMVAGRLEPRAVRRLMARLDLGYGQGLARQRGGGQVTRSPMSAFRAFPFEPRRSVVLSGRIWQRARLRAEAAERVAAGEIVTLVLLSPTTLYHAVRFDESGFWEQRGGLFGKSLRDDPPFRMTTFSSRVGREVQRVAEQRMIDG
mmetsp:Transcript_17998/g.27404  ORF Transcript_17998/g.27404 Transcript_17998/m.27404 type:complete len:415 (-) Transcript_17998:13246-14490(-)